MTTVTITQAHLKAVAPFASTSATRLYLNGVLFQKDLLIATDGHVLVAIKPKVFAPYEQHEDFILPNELIKKLLVVKPETKKEPVLLRFDLQTKTVTAFQHGKDQEAVIATIPLTFVDEHFPDWRRIIPKAENFSGEISPIGLNTELLGRFEAFGKSVIFHQNADSRSPSLVRSMNNDNFDALGVIMPTLVCAGAEMLPSWLEAKP